LTYLLSLVGIVVCLLLVLVWALRSTAKNEPPELANCLFGETGRGNASYLPQIRRAMANGDFVYLKSSGHPAMVGRLRKERKKIALMYLSALKEDFEKMVRFSRMVAGMSPEVVTLEEWERVLLTLKFRWSYQVVRLGLILGIPLSAELAGLSEVVSGLAVRMETAIAELGERAAIGMRMDSPLNGGGVDTP
jgi:hypothetical protein